MEVLGRKQVLGSGTAIGALIREAQYAESNADMESILKLLVSIIKSSKQKKPE